MALGRAWLGWASRLVLILALAWALTAPLEQPPKVANALQGDGRLSPETGFSVAPGAFDDYFRARGGL